MKTNKRTYQSMDDFFEDLNAKDKGRYIIMNCPCCEVKNSAFSYKKNLNFVQCNRQNECGETTIIEFEKDITSQTIKLEKNSYTTALSADKQKEINVLSEQLNHLLHDVRIDDKSCHTYRGLNQSNFGDYIVKFPTKDLGITLSEKLPHIFENYNTPAKHKLLENRDVIIPYFDDNNKVDRLLLRSSDPTDGAIKEINVLVQDNKENAMDYHVSLGDNLSESNKPIIISETIIDGLSLREIDKNIDFIAVSGVNHMRQAMQYVENNAVELSKRPFIIAMDNDKAGHAASVKWEKLLDAHGMIHTRFHYSDTEQHDLNDILTTDKDVLSKSYESSIKLSNEKIWYNKKTKQLIDSIEKKKTHLEYSKEICMDM